VAALGAIMTGALVLQIAASIVSTLVPLQMAVESQPPLLIGIVASAYSVGFLFGCFWIPTLIRRIGHIRGFAVFSALQATMTIGFVLLPQEWWGPARLGMGLAQAGHSIIIESWISGQAKAGNRGRIFGFYQIVNRLALVGSQIGVGYTALQAPDIFLIGSIAFSLALIPVSLTRARGPDAPPLVSLRLATVWAQAPAAVVACVYVGVMSGVLSNVAPAYGILIGLDRRGAILLTAATQLGALLAQWPLGLLADRMDNRRILLGGAAATTLATLALTALIHTGGGSRISLYLLFLLIGAGSIPLYAVAVTHAFARLGQDQAVGLSAGLLFLWGVGSTIGPLAATAPMQIFGPQGLLASVGLLSAGVASYLAVRLMRKPPPAPEKEPSNIPPRLPDIAPDRQ
jgi:MFS family permease